MNLRHFVVLWICFIFQLAQAFVVLPQGSTTAFGVLSSRSTRSASSSSSLLRVAQDNNFDMEELRQRIRQESVPQLFDSPNTNEHKVEDVFVILFRPGTHEQGAHTIEYPPGSGNNMILAFASLEACNKFAESLKLQNFFEKTFVDPMPQQFKLSDLVPMCDRLGVFVQVVPVGVELIPPSQNVKTFGLDPSLKECKQYLNYIFAMDDAELEEVGVMERIEDYLTESFQYHPSDGSWE